MHYKIPKDRNQLMLLPSIDLWLSQDNPVRLFDTIIDEIIKANHEDFQWKGNSNKGCTSYSPNTMFKLLLYGYFNWLPGSRRLENETYRNIELIWLLGDLHPDHWVICEFRRENKEQIKKLAIKFRKFLKAHSYIEGTTVAFDGSKMKANAKREMLSQDKLIKRLEHIERKLDEYMENFSEIDQVESELEQTQEEVDSQKQKRDLLKKEVAVLEEQQKKLEYQLTKVKSSGKKYLALNDPEANLMKSRDGKMPCYNVQSGVDAKHKMITLAEVSDKETDIDLLESDVKLLKEQIDITPEIVEADKGYANINQIQKIEQTSNTQCYIPLPENPKTKKDKNNGIHFEYNEQEDHYTCINGKKLDLITKNITQRANAYNIYQCKECLTCSKYGECTKSKKGRIVKRNVNQSWILKYKKKLETENAQEKIKQRKTLVEHPFGTIKRMMGKLCFLLTSKVKVQIEVDLYSTVYNLKRLINIEDLEKLMVMVRNYDWKIA